MVANTPARMRTIRNIETGEITTQSSNKTKRLLKPGGYEEVKWHTGPGDVTIVPAPRSNVWRRIGIGAAAILVVLAMLGWLRLVQMI